MDRRMAPVRWPAPLRSVRPHVKIHVRFMILVLGAYKKVLSPLLPAACRFHPTCSMYAAEAVARHGARRGLVLAVRRIGRCHPFHAGGFDPVP